MGRLHSRNLKVSGGTVLGDSDAMSLSIAVLWPFIGAKSFVPVSEVAHVTCVQLRFTLMYYADPTSNTVGEPQKSVQTSTR